MRKWLSNLIILSLVFTGLALSAPEVDRLFFSEIVTAPEKGTPQVETQKEVQIAPKNDTINSGSVKTPTIRSTSTSGITWEGFNQMSQNQLETINGVGPVLAKRILDYRAEHGPFKSFKDLDKVKGIGPKLLEKIKKEFSVQ